VGTLLSLSDSAHIITTFIPKNYILDFLIKLNPCMISARDIMKINQNVNAREKLGSKKPFIEKQI